MGIFGSKIPVDENQKLIFIDDEGAVSADWSNEGCCIVTKRFFGLEEMSESERRKRKQRYRSFEPGIHEYSGGVDEKLLSKLGLDRDAMEAIVRIQGFYRSYRCLQMFKCSVLTTIERIRRSIYKYEEVK